jgi:galactose mutarotase-like enzyme
LCLGGKHPNPLCLGRFARRKRKCVSQLSITRGTTEGFDTVEVDTGALSLCLIPMLGGKINSLRDGRSGREWLWRHPRMAYQRVPHGSSYVQTADTGGWDECFPSVSACANPTPPRAGAPVQDHGELWSQPATLAISEAGDRVALRTRWQGIVLPYTFERIITATADSARLRFEYSVTSNADEPIHFIWSAHPLVAIEPGMQLLLPPEARFNCLTFAPDGGPKLERGVHFPLTVQSSSGAIDLARLPDPTVGVALKLWSDPCDAGWATLRARDGEFRMQWDPARLPQVAVWMNLGAIAFDGGAPYFNMGLEPCIGAQDSLAEAVATYHLFEILPPRRSRSWWLEVELAG